MRAKRLTYSQVEFLCEQLAMILGSGMSVSEGLGLLCADSDDRVLVSACNEISSEVDRGEPLSQAMRSTGRFPEYAVDMVALGEMSGKLEDVLRGLAEYYEERDEIRRMLRSAVLHPMVLLLMMTVVIIVLVVMVIPMFGDIFSQFDSSVSATVQHTVDMAYEAGLIIMIVLLAIIAASAVTAVLSAVRKSGGGTRRLFSILPFTRGISEKLALADLTKAVCVTVSAGVSPAEDAAFRYQELHHRWQDKEKIRGLRKARHRGRELPGRDNQQRISSAALCAFAEAGIQLRQL